MFPSGPHDEFLELCAVSTSGQLSQEDQQRLREHLALCPGCREALQQYESIVHQAIPAIASKSASKSDPGPSWSQRKAEKVFFERLEQEENRKRTGVEDRSDIPTSPRTLLPFAPESTWRHVWMLYAAGILLFITLGFSAYWVGMRRGTEVAKVSVATPKVQNQVPLQSQASLEEQLSDAAHEREIAHARSPNVTRTSQTSAGGCSSSHSR